jgi:hypothetical protein
MAVEPSFPFGRDNPHDARQAWLPSPATLLVSEAKLPGGGSLGCLFVRCLNRTKGLGAAAQDPCPPTAELGGFPRRGHIFRAGHGPQKGLAGRGDQRGAGFRASD